MRSNGSDHNRAKFMSQMRNRHVFTTGQVARICGVASRTAGKWMDSGILKSYRVPTEHGSHGDRRAARADLIEFVRKYKMRLTDFNDERKLVLLSFDQKLPALVAARLPRPGWAVQPFTDLMLFGASVSRDAPDACLIDLAVGAGPCASALKLVRQYSNVLVIGVGTEDGRPAPEGCDAALPAGPDPAAVAGILLNHYGTGDDHECDQRPQQDAPPLPPVSLQAG
jgi:hypothetical protein